jgi:hypothetical protein
LDCHRDDYQPHQTGVIMHADAIAFVQAALAVIRRSRDFSHALRRSRFLGELLWKNNIGCYQLIELEQYLIAHYANQFEAIVAGIEPMTAPSSTTQYLHVLTKAYDTGGHTRVVERLIGSAALAESAVLVSESVAANSQAKLARAKLGLLRLRQRSAGVARTTEFLQCFARFEVIVLHIHPHDIEAVFAAALAKRQWGRKILLYNHADHVFSFGYAVADRVLELGHFGWALRAQRHTGERACFVGIPLPLNPVGPNERGPRESKPEPSAQTGPHAASGCLISSGAAYKFKPNRRYSFPAFARTLTQHCPLPLLLIGPTLLRNPWWWRSAIAAGKQIRFRKTMPHAEYLQTLRQARAYIDSFPVTGGTSFPEILSLGVPCFGVLTGAHGYSPADQLKSANLPELLAHLRQFLAGANPVQANGEPILAQLAMAHGLEQVAERIAAAADSANPLTSPPWHNPQAIDHHFYERDWLAQKIFSPTLHSLPDWRIGGDFIRFWLRQRFGRKAADAPV